MQLKCFVIISNGITQWARWQCNTGDPRSHGEETKARGNLSRVEVDLRPRRCCEQTWHSLPAKGEDRLSWVSRTAIQILRHKGMHAEDGSVNFCNFYHHVMKKGANLGTNLLSLCLNTSNLDTEYYQRIRQSQISSLLAGSSPEIFRPIIKCLSIL